MAQMCEFSGNMGKHHFMQSSKSGWNIWLSFWAFSVSFCWLLPNHSPPWLWFHSDGWAAAMLLLAVPVILVTFRRGLVWFGVQSTALVLACIPMTQYAFGLITQFGTAWMATAYLVGFLYATMLGSYWESNRPGQVVDAVLLAIGIAAIASVAMQIYQWFGLESLNMWVLGAEATRQSANLGQPNQLGSLLLLGCMSIAWAYERQKIGGMLATVICAFVVTGVALTGSRAAWIGAVILIGFTWVWRHRWRNPAQHWVATALLAYLLILVACLPLLRHVVFEAGGGYAPSLQQIARTNGEQRFVAWSMFLQAIWVKPWFGFGWAQVAYAHAQVADLYPQLRTTFSSSHNLLLDALLSCGIPLGLLLLGLLAWWLYKTGRAIANAENAILFLTLLVLLNHAMLELPLYYGYFLWPAGIFMGVLTVRTATAKHRSMRWYCMPVGWLVCTLMLVLTVRDYLAVEEEYQASTMNEVSIHSTRTLDTHSYPFLTQWDDFFKYGRLMPVRAMQDQDIAGLQNVALMWPNAGLFNKLAMALAIRNRPEEAAMWLRRLCAMTQEENCANVVQYWQNDYMNSPEFTRVRLPSLPGK